MSSYFKSSCYILLLSLFTGLSLAAPKSHEAAVVSASPQASAAGLSILKQGGNAFDAAVAVAATLAVTEPYHTGLGGGGFWLLHTEKNKQDIFVDARETAAAAASAEMYSTQTSKASLDGPLSAAIPGEPLSLVLIAKNYGRLPLSTDLKPAIDWAEKGFVVDQRYQRMLEKRLSVLQSSPEASAIFLRDNQIPALGTRIIQKNLAQTLQLLADKGAPGFYQGPLAQSMVDAVRANGGLWTLADLAHYQIKFRKPLIGYYHGIKIVTVGPPSAGGLALLTMLNILSDYPLSSLPRSQRIHYAVEAMRFAFYDRFLYLGDPDFVAVPVKFLLSKAHTQAIQKNIFKDRATPSKNLVNAQVETSPNTSDFSILDRQGNRVSATITINNLFGSGFVAGNSGVLLNDEMDDFTTAINQPNLFGVSGSKANIIAPGKRPLSSMAPTFLISKDKVAILGSTGGSKIPTAILWAVLAFADHQPVNTWVSLKRIHHQYLPDQISYEKNALSPADKAALLKQGYTLKLSPDVGNMQAILWNTRTGEVSAASDPRGEGAAMVF